MKTTALTKREAEEAVAALQPLAELHAHLGSSISPSVLWEIAHDLGVKLPKKEFSEFRDFILLSPEHRMPLNEYFKKVYHPILDRLSSGTHAVEQATYQTMAGAYRVNGITRMELRNNPMKHNQNSLLDMDHIIIAMLHGMERALLAYPKLSAGLIFCMAREFKVEENTIIVEKAIKYRRRGVVGIDIAGPGNPDFHFKDYEEIFDMAHDAGMKVTVHTGEQKDSNDMWEALEFARPHRIGHGILAAYDKPLMKEITKRGIVLEVCPLSNIVTKAVENYDEMKFILRTMVENKVKFCINTDWPEVIEDCRLGSQMALLLEKGMLSLDELKACNQIAFDATFIPRKSGLQAYL